LQDECVTAYIPNPDMGADDLLHALCHELDIPMPQSARRNRLLNALKDCLIKHALEGHRVVVLIDEAQAIPLATVESLRLLSNLETEKRKLLQLVLLGQPELDTKLALPQIRQLLQRITFSEYLGPMHAPQVAPYLMHRLAVAAASDATDTQVFLPQAAADIAVCSAGVPRVVNVLAHKCLMLAYGEDTHRVTPNHVQLAAEDTPGVRGKPVTQLRGPRWWLPTWLRSRREVS